MFWQKDSMEIDQISKSTLLEEDQVKMLDKPMKIMQINNFLDDYLDRDLKWKVMKKSRWLFIDVKWDKKISVEEASDFVQRFINIVKEEKFK